MVGASKEPPYLWGANPATRVVGFDYVQEP